MGRRLLTTCMLLLGFFISPTLLANWVFKESFNNCEGAWPAPPFELRFERKIFQENLTWRRWGVAYRVYDGGIYIGRECVITTDEDLVNDPNGPEIGNITVLMNGEPIGGPPPPNFPPTPITKDILIPNDETLDLICVSAFVGCLGVTIVPFVPGGIVVAPVVPIVCGAVNTACGVRETVEFLEKSPASFTWFVPPNTNSLIPFVVRNKGDGDWISMSIDGVEFFRKPLSAFTENEVYFAHAPPALLVGELNKMVTVFLESTGEANAEFFIPIVEERAASTMTSQVPIPWLALGLLATLLTGFGLYRKTS